ncbi:MAG: Gram-negative bacterial tonB protein [bacterium ADurb.Bin478]|nr:MAG: Gram-negative bacterial tonB protein [bacterium ADurb.Bin478]
MSYDIQQQLRSIKQTREQMVQLHQFLRDKLYRYAKEQGLVERREEMNSPHLVDSLLELSFPPAIRTELSIVLAQLKQLHSGLSHLDSEIQQLEKQWQDFKKTPHEPEPKIARPLQVKSRTYGAVELKRAARRFTAWGLGLAALIHFILLGVYWTANSLMPEPEKPKTVRVKYIELNTPPSITQEPPGGSGPGGTKVYGGLAARNPGVLGIIVPVDDATYKANTKLLLDDRSLQDLDRLMSQAQTSRGNGNGDGYGEGGGLGNGRGAGQGDGLDLDHVEVTGGIDDLISDAKKVETVKLEKKGQVNIQAPSQMRGSQAAMVRRSSESVMAVIQSQQGRIMYTYTKYLRTNAELRGKVSIDITIEPDGTVSNAGVVESTMNQPDFDREILNILRRLRFEPVPEGSVTVNLPFVFSRTE